MEDMSLPALFEQARRIHLTASESAVDQVIISHSVLPCVCGRVPISECLWFAGNSEKGM